eukprot:364596-Chlamydomonas_euryale.AAC.2
MQARPPLAWTRPSLAGVGGRRLPAGSPQPPGLPLAPARRAGKVDCQAPDRLLARQDRVQG